MRSLALLLALLTPCAARAQDAGTADLDARARSLAAELATPGPHDAGLRCELGNLLRQLHRGLPDQELDRGIAQITYTTDPTERITLARCLYLRGIEEQASGWQRRTDGYDPTEVARAYYERSLALHPDPDAESRLAALPPAPVVRVVSVPLAITIADDLILPAGVVPQARALVSTSPGWEMIVFRSIPAGPVRVAARSAAGWQWHTLEDLPCCADDVSTSTQDLRVVVRQDGPRAPMLLLRVLSTTPRLGEDGYCETDADGHCTWNNRTAASWIWWTLDGRLASFHADVSVRIDHAQVGDRDFARVAATSRGIVVTCTGGHCARVVHSWTDLERAPSP